MPGDSFRSTRTPPHWMAFLNLSPFTQPNLGRTARHSLCFSSRRSLHGDDHATKERICEYSRPLLSLARIRTKVFRRTNRQAIPMNKPGRHHRGSIWSLVRKLAHTRKNLSAPDLVPPLQIAQAKNALNELHEKGELTRLKKDRKSV